MQRAGTPIQGDALGRAAIDRKFLLKLCHLGAKDELATFQHAGNRSIDFGLNALILLFEVEIRHFDVCHKTTEFYCIRDCGSMASPVGKRAVSPPSVPPASSTANPGAELRPRSPASAPGSLKVSEPTVSTRCAPSRVFSRHAKDHHPDLFVDRWTTSKSLSSGEPLPVEPKTAAMPLNDSSCGHEDTALLP